MSAGWACRASRHCIQSGGRLDKTEPTSDPIMSDVSAPAPPAPPQKPPELPPTFAAFAPPPKKNAIDKVRYSHDAMIDMIVANPWISQGELARNFGYTEGWVSQVIASDAFQARLAERKNELVDPYLRATIEERFKGLVVRSIEILMRKLDETKVSDETALRAAEIAAKALGYGNRGPQVQVNTSFVVQVPPKAASVEAWAKQYGAGGPALALPPADRALQEATDAVLVEPSPAAPQSQALLDELRSK